MNQTRRGKTFRDLVMEAKGQIKETDVAGLKQMMAADPTVVVLDVRETADFKAGHIPGAIHLSRGVLELEIDEVVPDQDTQIVAYCGGGSRSALAALTLQRMGYENVCSLAGGWKAWSSQ